MDTGTTIIEEKQPYDATQWVLTILFLGYACWPIWVIPVIALKLWITGTL